MKNVDEKPGFIQRILGFLHKVQVQQEAKTAEMDKKTGLTQSERDTNKYNRDLSMEENLNESDDDDED